MGKTVKQKFKELPLERQKKIKDRSAELMAEEVKRQQIRQLFKITQEQMGQPIQANKESTFRVKQSAYLIAQTVPPPVVNRFSDNQPINYGIGEV